MGTPSAKRISAKLTTAPTRNSLNILGASGQGAKQPIKLQVTNALQNSMNSGKMPNAAVPPGMAKYNRKKQVSFGDTNAILNSPTKQIKGNPMDALPSGKGNKVGFPGNGVD